MSRIAKISIIAVVSVLALGLAFAAGTVVKTGIASAAAGVSGVFHGGRGGRDGFGPGFPGGENQDQYLADALGISLTDLQTAYTTAQDEALKEAVTQGLITQAQADEIKARSANGDGHGFGLGRGFDKGFGGPNSTIDFDALLAKALNITTDQLSAAREKAQQAAVDAAVANGDMTQKQADLMKAQQALRTYTDRETLTAKALGMTVDELTAARQAGKDMSTLLTEKGMTQTQFEEAYQAAYKAAVAQAVTDGVITQAQADLVLANPGPMGGFGGRGGHGGPGGPMGGGFGPGGNCPPSGAPSTTPAPTNGTNSNGL